MGRQQRGKNGASHGSENPDFEVGYGKPPKEFQFKPGNSGNSKGRPRDAENLQTTVRRQFGKRVKVKEKGRVRSVTKADAWVGGIIDRALLGDAKFSQQALSLARTEGINSPESNVCLVNIRFVDPDDPDDPE